MYTGNVYRIREKLFDRMDSFGNKYTSELKHFKKLAIFDVEAICVHEKTSRDTNTTTWMRKHATISVSNFSNLVEGSTFLCISEPLHLIASFIDALENFVSQSKAKMENLFPIIDTTTKIKLGRILKKLTQRHVRREQLRRFDINQGDCGNKKCASTQFLQIQQKQSKQMQELFEQYCNVLPVIDFNSAKYDLKSFKTSLLPILVNERDIELTVIKKANQLISFKFCDNQLLDNMNF